MQLWKRAPIIRILHGWTIIQWGKRDTKTNMSINQRQTQVKINQPPNPSHYREKWLPQNIFYAHSESDLDNQGKECVWPHSYLCKQRSYLPDDHILAIGKEGKVGYGSLGVPRK